MPISAYYKKWTIKAAESFEGLLFHQGVPIPSVGEDEVLVKFYAASLNYRDIAISRIRTYPLGHNDGVVPGSDGAGLVVLTGTKVKGLHVGDKVLTMYNQVDFGGSLNPEKLKSDKSGPGGKGDGTLAEYGVFNETSLVRMPESLTWEEAATLPVAGVTAWNALYGLEGRKLKAGDYVLTQGTGGTSIFALQLAVAAGAVVIATTSSSEKEARLKALGVAHVINYRSNPNWGEIARSISGGIGVDHVIEVGGPASIAQSLKAVRIDGVINLIGFLGGVKDPNEPSYFEILMSLCTVRGLLCGNKVLSEELVRAIDNCKIKPIYDKIFSLEEAKEAHRFVAEQKHFAKVVVKIAE